MHRRLTETSLQDKIAYKGITFMGFVETFRGTSSETILDGYYRGKG